MQRFDRTTRLLRSECHLATSIWRSRDCLASKAILLLGLGYEFGPWPPASDHPTTLGYLDALFVAFVAIGSARLLIPSDYARRIAERYEPAGNADTKSRSLWRARLLSFLLTQWLLAVRNVRLSGVHLRSLAAAVVARMSAVRNRRGASDRLFALVGYRLWWWLRSPNARRRCDDDSIVVIGGAARSGTTLLRSMLGRHPLIASGPETTVFLHRISSPADLGPRLGWDVAEIERWQRDSRSQVEFIERFREAVRCRSGKPVWAEKTPRNVFRFSFVRRHFPRAKLVHIVRDGRDAVCSLRRTPFAKLDHAPWDSVAAALRCGVQWRNSVRAGLRFRGDPAYYELRYEQLVRDPESALRGLLDFLGLPWDDAVLRPLAAGLCDPEEIAAAGRLFHSSVQRWHRDLSDEDRRALCPLIGPLLVELAYAQGSAWTRAHFHALPLSREQREAS